MTPAVIVVSRRRRAAYRRTHDGVGWTQNQVRNWQVTFNNAGHIPIPRPRICITCLHCCQHLDPNKGTGLLKSHKTKSPVPLFG